ncbi:LOW QUALITY PROTEIN: neuroblastoma-amplified sequence [Bufo gargarizans]|uniref:LOW QUALITY PROTEIN: neuroblastoma-amplified sequence n=1 Tax=Bufo gargarizans TaxID=30331 RepID=UPI001CF0E96A|nr:LOW QUALITY PROTEIN: neuroblastoma-amplified sequence [Bufo gargarizans]
MAAPMDEAVSGNSEENILYDLLINTEWPPEPDVQPRGGREHGASFVLTKTITAPAYYFLQLLWYSPAKFSLPSGLVRLVSKQINWQLVLTSNGKLLAAVQDQCIEIRSAKDDFGSVIGKCQVPKDPNPQWRHVAWSHDCTLVAYAESTGTVRLFDLMGSELFVIPPQTSFPGDMSYAIAGLIFLEYKASTQWSAELLAINYRGQLKSYLVSVGANHSYQESHSFNFGCHYSQGISSVVYLPDHRLLLVGGSETNEDGVSEATQCGLTSWRVLSGSPHYKQVTNYKGDVGQALKGKGLWRIIKLRLSNRHGSEQDGIFRMSLSPDGNLLAAVHFSGRLSIWEIPSLRLQREWPQSEQPKYDEINPDWQSSVEKRKKMKDKESYYPLIDVNWWADNAVILARCSGSLTVSSVKTLKNLLGKSCEWFEPSPQVTAAHDGGFLSLECEVKLASKRSRLESRAGEEEYGDQDSDFDDEMSAKDRYLSYIKQGLYFATEMERFAPPRKRPRTITKMYRLVSLRSTTPEELYQRKIDNEEYGEALSLAHAYGLDTDLVYQRQWRKSAVNIATIQDYLSKIKKRSWVLHECLERVPENVDAAKELLMFGLKGTDLEALVAIGNGEDGGRFILPGDVDFDDIAYEDFLTPEEEAESRIERENQRRKELLQRVDFDNLTLEQKEICRCRLKLLTYLDRLSTYEEILGGHQAAEKRYDADFFKKFRNQNIVLSARTYARESNVQALDLLFTFHGSDLLPHRLAILSNFPETTPPHKYAILLPEASFEAGELKIVAWNEQEHRDKDWCEEPRCKSQVEPGAPDLAEFLYEEQPVLLIYSTDCLSIDIVKNWFWNRAEEIENYSRQVDGALSLVRLGKEKNIPGLELLCDDLVTLETLVYEANCDVSLTLKDLHQLKDIEKLRLLLENSSEENYVKNAYQWMVPFLHRCEAQTPGASNTLLKEYIVTLAKDDLKFPLKIFQHSKPDCQQKLIPVQDQLMIIALESIYICERDDQLSLCYDILECLPQRGYGMETDISKSLHDKVDQLEQILSVSEILEKHGLQKPISFVKETQSSLEEARKLIVRLTRHTGRKQPPVSESHWKGLLQDLLDMQQNVYTCLNADVCYEIFAESLLCSGRHENIKLAGHMMHCNSTSVDLPVSINSKGKPQYRVSYGKSAELVLAASREYFNSSATLTDDCMDLARSCLHLITDCPDSIQEELDLIRSLGYLEEFGVKILPLQVRLCSNRLSLIKKCISQSPTSYKQSAKLLALAHLLRVAGNEETEMKGQVFTLLAEQALQCQDYKAANGHCQELLTAGYNKSWEICSKLGQCESYEDLGTRKELMAFALTHCPPCAIQTLLAASSSLQTQILFQAVNYQIHPGGGGEGLENSQHLGPPGSAGKEEASQADSKPQSVDLLHRTTATTMKVLTNTTLTTKAVLHAVSDGQFWKKSLTYLRPLNGLEQSSTSKSAKGSTTPGTGQGCQPFYESLIVNPFIAEGEATYTTYQYNSQESFAEVLLRTGKLAETKSEGDTLFPATEVLLQLASDTLPNDITLSVAYLLALPQVLDANKCFEKQSHSALSLQLAAYYYSLQIYAHLAPCFKDKCHPLYRADPNMLIKLVTKYVSDYANANWPIELVPLIEQLHYYNERLVDFTQAQILQGLGKGVDVQRFATDSQYKTETILGLAETLEENVYKISLSLAQRYRVPLWEVYMTHLEYLFCDSGLSTTEIEARAKSLGLFDTLKANPEAFCEHMAKYVYPTIEGRDLQRLLYYFTLLENCGCSHYVKHIKPDSHVKLLKKLKAVASGLDYKRMTDAGLNPLESLAPVLTSHNVLAISKLAARIPDVEGNMLSSSAVHAAWLKKLFWNGDPQLLKEAPKTVTELSHAYDICRKYLDRLTPGDLIAFIDEITFTPRAVDKLTMDARSEMTKKTITSVRQFLDKQKKKTSGEVAEASHSSVTYNGALSHLQQSLAHLETLGLDFVEHLRSLDQDRVQKYSHMYDLSRSEKEKLRNLALTMCLNGQSLNTIQKLLEVAVGDIDISPKDIVRSSTERIIAKLSGNDLDSGAIEDPLKVLEAIVREVHLSTERGENLVTSDDLLEWLRPFCGDDSLPVKPRIDVLQIMEQAFNLSDEDSRLLVFFRTQAILKASWPEKKVDVADIENEEKRYLLFVKLLDISHTLPEFQHLVLLLQAWPPMKGLSIASQEDNPWVKLVKAMLSSCGAEKREGMSSEVLKLCRSFYKSRHAFSVECIDAICSLLLEHDMLLTSLKLFIESGDPNLHSKALKLLTAVTKVTDSNCDSEILSLLLDAKLLVNCIGTIYYSHLINHLLAASEESRWNVEEISRELRDSGYKAEAGSLLMSYRGTHPALQTFTSALSSLKRWL